MKRPSPSLLTGAGAARALLAAALLAASFSSSVAAPAAPAASPETPSQSPLATPTDTPLFVARVLPEEFEIQAAEGSEEPAGEMPTFPDDAAAFRYRQLQDEKGDVPAEAMIKANNEYLLAREKTLLSPSRDAGGISPGAWSSEGPTNVGGRIRSMVIPPAHPDWQVIGSPGGGIWFDRHDGSGWHASNDFMANLNVSAMGADPVAGTLYAGTGEGFGSAGARLRGNGVFVSTDSGQSWAQLPSTSVATTPNFEFVNRIAVAANGSALAVATENGLFRSIDGGTVFTRVISQDTKDVVFHPTVITQAVASGNGWVRYSTDGGASWSSATGLSGVGGRIEVAFSRSNPNLVYASANNNGGEVYVSTNGGAGFTLANTTQNLLRGQGW